LTAGYHRGQAAVDALAFTAPLREDRPGTGCGVLAERCARTGVPPREAAAAVAADLRRAGLTPGPVTCGARSGDTPSDDTRGDNPSTDCTVRWADGPVQVVARASDRVRDLWSGTEYPAGSTAVGVATDVVGEPDGLEELLAADAETAETGLDLEVSTPLPALDDLVRLPDGWPTPPCVRKAPDGCDEYAAVFTVEGSPEAARQALVARLVASPLRLAEVNGASVRADLFRAPGHRDLVTVAANIKEREGRTRVLLMVMGRPTPPGDTSPPPTVPTL
jgi:hypothetical protein